MAISSLDGLISAGRVKNPQKRHFAKDIGANLATTDPALHLFGYGNLPPAGTYDNTKAGTQITSSRTGVLGFSNPSSPSLLQLEAAVGRYLSSSVTDQGGPSVVIIDHLVHYGGFSGSSSSNQNPTNPSSPMLPRYQDGYDVLMAAVLATATAIGGAAPTLTITFDDESGNSQSVNTVVRTDGTVLGRVIHAGGDYFLPTGFKGVQRITQVKLSATTGAAGTYAIVLFKVLGILPLFRFLRAESFALGMQELLPQIYDDAALDFLLVNGSTAALNGFGVSGHLIAQEG